MDVLNYALVYHNHFFLYLANKMANRGATWDPMVHTIADLKEHGSKKLTKMYRDYYNEGAMDLVT